MIFEWDAGKASSNLKKHRVSFEDAASVFFDPFALTYDDPEHSSSEPREITIGHTRKRKLVFVSHVERQNRIRIISARPVTRRERKQYEESSQEA